MARKNDYNVGLKRNYGKVPTEQPQNRNPIIENVFEYKGYTCVVVLQALGHRCGYVGIPKDKELDIDYSKVVECHGGITHEERTLPNNVYKSKEVSRWIGFDTFHLGDALDYEVALEAYKDDEITCTRLNQWRESGMFSQGTIRTTEYCENECRKIVEILLNLQSLETLNH